MLKIKKGRFKKSKFLTLLLLLFLKKIFVALIKDRTQIYSPVPLNFSLIPNARLSL